MKEHADVNVEGNVVKAPLYNIIIVFLVRECMAIMTSIMITLYRVYVLQVLTYVIEITMPPNIDRTA